MTVQLECGGGGLWHNVYLFYIFMIFLLIHAYFHLVGAIDRSISREEKSGFSPFAKELGCKKKLKSDYYTNRGSNQRSEQ